jgi:hypothetical protein
MQRSTPALIDLVRLVETLLAPDALGMVAERAQHAEGLGLKLNCVVAEHRRSLLERGRRQRDIAFSACPVTYRHHA